MRFSTRLIITVAVVVVAFAAVSFLSLTVVSGVQQFSQTALEVQELSSAAWHLQSLTWQIQVSPNMAQVVQKWLEAKEYLLGSLESVVTDAGRLNRGTENQQLADTLEDLQGTSRILSDQLDSYTETLSDMSSGFADYPAGSLQAARQRSTDLALLRTISRGELVAIYLDDTLQAVVARVVEALDAAEEESSQLILIFFFAVVGAAVLVVITMNLLFLRSLNKRFSNIGASMNQLAQGDLTVKLSTKGKNEVSALSRHIQNYIEEFARVVADIKGIAEAASGLRSDLMAGSEESAASVTQIGGNIDSISRTIGDLDGTIEETGKKLEEINQGMQDLERQIERQSHTVEESSSAVEEMTASVTSVSKIADERRQAAERLRAVTNEGHKNVAGTDENVQAIANSVEEILGIITVINKIAGQTSILSMNAAIEAAHAGEYGRGFSVVAEEIRRLSDDTNANAKRIKDQLGQVADLVTKTQEGSETTRASFASIEEEVGSTASALEEISATMRELSEGTASVLESTQEAGKVTTEIRGDATRAAARTTEITQDMKHVRDISTTVRGGIDEIGVGTREINRMVQNLSDVTQAITDQIDRLSSSVSRFRTAEGPGAQGDGETPDKSNAVAAPPADDAAAHEEAREQDSEETGATTTGDEGSASTTGDEGSEAPLG